MESQAYGISIILKDVRMSVSTIPGNIAAMLNKAYNTDAGTVTASGNTGQQATSVSDGNSPPVSASAEVSLGQRGNTTEIYTAQGLLQQMRQIQLSNTQLLFGDSASSNDESSSLFGLPGNADNPDLESMSKDWTQTISQHPAKAAVMVESARNTSLGTILA